MRALVTGAKGQLGHYLVPLLEERGYEVDCGEDWDYSKSPDEVYILHQIRHEQGVDNNYGVYMRSVQETADLLEDFSPLTRIVFCGSIIQDLGTSPWHLSRQFIAKLVDQFPNAWMPRLPQFVSKHVNPKRQYTGQILHELASGIKPTPLRPDALIEVVHARDVALTLVSLHRELIPKHMSLSTYISLAKTPGTWLNQIVEEIRDAHN